MRGFFFLIGLAVYLSSAEAALVKEAVSYEHEGAKLEGYRLERIAYNALPGTFTPDFWAHQYDQQTNQVLCTVAKRNWSSNGDHANIFGWSRITGVARRICIRGGRSSYPICGWPRRKTDSRRWRMALVSSTRLSGMAFEHESLWRRITRLTKRSRSFADYGVSRCKVGSSDLTAPFH